MQLAIVYLKKEKHDLLLPIYTTRRQQFRRNGKCRSTLVRQRTSSAVMSHNNGFYFASVMSGFVFTLLTLRGNAISRQRPPTRGVWSATSVHPGVYAHLRNTRISRTCLPEVNVDRESMDAHRCTLSLSIVERVSTLPSFKFQIRGISRLIPSTRRSSAPSPLLFAKFILNTFQSYEPAGGSAYSLRGMLKNKEFSSFLIVDLTMVNLLLIVDFIGFGFSL